LSKEADELVARLKDVSSVSPGLRRCERFDRPGIEAYPDVIKRRGDILVDPRRSSRPPGL